MKGCGGELEKKNTVCGNNPGQNISDKLQFFSEIAPYEKSSFSIFQKFFTSIDKILILGARLKARVQFLIF